MITPLVLEKPLRILSDYFRTSLSISFTYPMKSNTIKRIAVIAILAVTATIATVYFIKLNSKEVALTAVNPAYGEFISSYTAGVVSSGSSIRVVMASEVVDSASLGETSVKLFEFNPSVKGTTVWLDRRTVEFRPSSRLLSGQAYELSFNLA